MIEVNFEYCSDVLFVMYYIEFFFMLTNVYVFATHMFSEYWHLAAIFFSAISDLSRYKCFSYCNKYRAIPSFNTNTFSEYLFGDIFFKVR